MIRYAPAGSDDLKAAKQLLQGHYTGTHGNAGRMYVAYEGGSVVGACLVGESCSQRASRSLIAAPWQVSVIKRLYMDDAATTPESQLLRQTMRLEANYRGETRLFVAYADPAARDTRTGQPLLGRVYFAAHMFYIGDTKCQRWAFRDAHGRVRSPRQGGQTLNRGTMPADWTRLKLPPARIWATVVAPNVGTSVLWRKRQRKACWSALVADRRVAAKQWIERRCWQRWVLHGRAVPIAPHADALRYPNEVRRAWWRGADLQNRAAPVWIGQSEQLMFDAVEITAHRSYHAIPCV